MGATWLLVTSLTHHLLRENGNTLLCIRGNTTKISHEDIRRVTNSRGAVTSSTSSMEALSIVSDLVNDSLSEWLCGEVRMEAD